ncbi:ECs1072 family phage-associated protein, partial [Yersinia enterocolitica]
YIRCNAHAIVCLVTSPPQAAVVSWEFSHNQEGIAMSVISERYFDIISNKIFALHDIARFGSVVEPQHTQCRNRSALIFALESILHLHREAHGTIWNPLEGRKALEHLLLQKYKWPLSEIRALSLADIVLLLQSELAPERLPEEVISVLRDFSSLTPKKSFPEFMEDEWDPELYLTIPKQQNW